MSLSFGATSLTSFPSIYSSPSLISSSPATMRSVVDLPQPDGPTSTMNSLSLIEILTSWTAVTLLSYTFLRFFNTTSDIPVSSWKKCENWLLHRNGTFAFRQRDLIAVDANQKRFAGREAKDRLFARHSDLDHAAAIGQREAQRAPPIRQPRRKA